MTGFLEPWNIVEALPIPVLVLDANHVVVAANTAGIATFLRERSDVVGRNFKDLAVEPWRTALGEPLDRLRRDGHACVVSADVTATDATATAPSAHLVPLRRADGSVEGILLTTNLVPAPDPTLSAKLREANAELDAANDQLNGRLQELRTAYRHDDERIRFLAMLAHELRNPLAGITSALHLLRRRHVVVGDRLAEQALRIAERQSKSQARLLDDLLDASRLVLGKIALRIEPTDFATIVRQVVETTQPAIRARAQILRADVPAAPVVVMGDAVRLEQVVANVLGNAVKYTPPGGEITVTLSATPETAALTVCDTGAGIEPSLLEQVFELFTQGDATWARVAGGLGIGLTVARALIEQHRGTIEARSAGRGHGTTVEVHLPCTDANPVTEGRPPRTAPPRSRRILIVDDNRDARDMLHAMLELDGHQVQGAAEGHAAVRLAVEWTPEVALIDIGLPEVDGYEVARRIRKRLGDAVRLIAVTGYGDAEARQLATEAGFDEHLVKPVDPDALADLLRAG